MLITSANRCVVEMAVGLCVTCVQADMTARRRRTIRVILKPVERYKLLPMHY